MKTVPVAQLTALHGYSSFLLIMNIYLFICNIAVSFISNN